MMVRCSCISYIKGKDIPVYWVMCLWPTLATSKNDDTYLITIPTLEM